MKYNQLGNSGLLVSELCMGTMSFGSQGYWSVIGSLDYQQSKRLVDIALNAGINYFDTADVYSHGQSEELLGKALKEKRKEVVIATKVRGRMGQDINNVGLSRKHIIESCENSLKRLGTDYIDHYILHSFDPLTPLHETLSALTDLVHQGKVRYIGVSNFPAWQIMKALAIANESIMKNLFHCRQSILLSPAMWSMSLFLCARTSTLPSLPGRHWAEVF